jgi:predicted RNA-binding protein with PIN domain
MLERLAAEHRARERVCLVSSDVAVRGTSGQEVTKISSREFASTLEAVEHSEERPSRVADRLDPETRDRLERLRRAQE